MREVLGERENGEEAHVCHVTSLHGREGKLLVTELQRAVTAWSLVTIRLVLMAVILLVSYNHKA